MAPDGLSNIGSVRASKGSIERENENASRLTNALKKLSPVIMDQIMQPRCKSRVWVYFQRINRTVAKCRICNGNYKFGSSISNLSHHAKVKHGDMWKQGPVKFLEQLKLSQGHCYSVINRRGRNKRDIKTIRRKSQDSSQGTVVKIEPKSVEETDANNIEDEDIQRTLESIYEKADETVMDYMRLPNKALNVNTHIDRAQRESSSNTFSLDDEHEIDFLRSDDVINTNPSNNSGTASLNLDLFNFQRLKEERMRAETNYFHKKALFMERSAEYVEMQKRHLLLQTKKLEMELEVMRERFSCPQ